MGWCGSTNIVVPWQPILLVKKAVPDREKSRGVNEVAGLLGLARSLWGNVKRWGNKHDLGVRPEELHKHFI